MEAILAAFDPDKVKVGHLKDKAKIEAKTASWLRTQVASWVGTCAVPVVHVGPGGVVERANRRCELS